jgi:DHA2 family multidrug resistance protein
MAEIRDAQQIADGTTLITVVRSVFASLGIAVLATLVQTQTKVHFTHLAEQVTASSPIGQLLPRIEGLFLLRGADMHSATSAALQIIAGYVTRQGYLLAMRDAFFLTLILTFIAIVATFFVRGVRRTSEQTEQETPAPALAIG